MHLREVTETSEEQSMTQQPMIPWSPIPNERMIILIGMGLIAIGVVLAVGVSVMLWMVG
jgi:hypothetical protein